MRQAEFAGQLAVRNERVRHDPPGPAAGCCNCRQAGVDGVYRSAESSLATGSWVEARTALITEPVLRGQDRETITRLVQAAETVELKASTLLTDSGVRFVVPRSMHHELNARASQSRSV